MDARCSQRYNEFLEYVELEHTVTHVTDIKGFSENQIGSFCEANGSIYSGYKKITATDCICQVVQSNEMNKKIVGIIVANNKFASHGDALVGVGEDISEMTVGDLLVPDTDGNARVALENEKQFISFEAIPRVKVTSVTTGIKGMVACFIS
jgi:hypothetical protein